MLDDLDSLLNEKNSCDDEEESFSPSIRKQLKKKPVTKHLSFLKLDGSFPVKENFNSMARHVSFNDSSNFEESMTGKLADKKGGNRENSKGIKGKKEEEGEFSLRRRDIGRRGYYDDLEFLENEGYEKQFEENKGSPKRKRTHSFDSFFNVTENLG